jgi:hypothetical protein
MAAERKPGSNRGRASIDWDGDGFLYYVSLQPNVRSYQAVADRFAVSVRTVERHALRGQWRKRAREHDIAAAEMASERLRDERADALVDLEKLIQASTVMYATQLRNGQTKVTPADLARLHKLRMELWELRDNWSTEEPTMAQQPTADVDSPEYQLEVVRALLELGLLPAPPLPPTEADEQGEATANDEAA